MKKKDVRVNEQITSPKVRIIGSDGKQIGILDIDKAKQIALDEGMDLVEIVPKANPPVCKVIDYGKYKYEQSKKEKKIKKKQHIIQVKEIRLSPKIEEHDLNFKLKHARKFIEQGNKVKISIFFKGRQITHKEMGQELMDQVAEELDDIAKMESKPHFEGRNLMSVFMKK